jgi:hypothetical protein
MDKTPGCNDAQQALLTQQAIGLLTQALNLLTPKSRALVVPEDTKQVLTDWIQKHTTLWAPYIPDFLDNSEKILLFDKAAKAGHDQVCRWILTAGPWGGFTQEFLDKMHYLAAYHERPDLLLWLSCKFLISARGWRHSLSTAASKNNASLVATILRIAPNMAQGHCVRESRNCDFGLAEDDGVLCVAARCGHVDVVRILYIRRAMDGVDMFETNALKFAVHNGHLSVVKYLATVGQTAPLTMLQCLRADNNAILRDAIGCNRLDIIHVLHQMGLTADDARPTLAYAVTCGFHDTVRAVCNMGLTIEDVRANNNSALQQAAKQGNHQIMLVLHEMGLTADDARANKNMALKIACEGGYTECVRVLLNMGLTIDDVLQDGECILHHVVKHGRIEILKVFQAHQLPVEHLRPWALCAAAAFGGIRMIQQLRVMGLTVEDARDDNCAALRTAINLGYSDTVKELVSWGLTRQDGETANEYMRELANISHSMCIKQIALDIVFASK